MRTDNKSISDVLALNATSFFIPPFQRAYAWGKPEIERFFNDILRIVKSELNPKQRDKQEHFFGTLVIKNEQQGFAQRSVVVDGQQRLTTTLIFLIALRDLEHNVNTKNNINNSYLINSSSEFEDKIKLKQVTRDWDSYRALVLGKDDEEIESGIVKNAYTLFKRLIRNQKNLNPAIQTEHYIIALQRMNVALIFLDERPFKGEDPQIIFETLNSLGKPLTLSDLIRNYILLEMESKRQSEVYESIWYPKIEAVLRDNTSKFFRDYLQYKTVSSIKVVSDNNTKEIYYLFKTYVEDNFDDKDDFIVDIVRFVQWYKWILSGTNNIISEDDNKNKEIKELLVNIFKDIKSEAFKPFVLGLLEHHQDKSKRSRLTDEQLITILKTIRTYLIRRRVLGLTQGENRNMVLLSNRITDLANGTVTMFELLTNQFYRLRLPNDIDIEKSLRSVNFYKGTKRYSKFVLGKIEENNSKVAINFRDSKVTIEHIMPQKLSKEWELELGANHQEVHKQYLDNIGNLILTEFNSEMSNSSFSKKKEELKRSTLSYRLDIIETERWDENAILNHQEKMIADFLKTFPIPDEYKRNDNWNIAMISEDGKLSPLDDDAADIARGNKPTILTVEGNDIKVSTWQDVFIEFLLYIKENYPAYFEVVKDNKGKLFQNEEVIISWALLQDILNENIDTTRRYKNLKGQFWDRTEDLTDDMLFIHINISANTCINRISYIMNMFSMSPSAVEISFKQ